MPVLKLIRSSALMEKVMVTYSHAKQKFHQAVDALVGRESRQMRLTDALDSSSMLQASDRPEKTGADARTLAAEIG